eukprot:2744972-Pyramimonas_sp.AAC.1
MRNVASRALFWQKHEARLCRSTKICQTVLDGSVWNWTTEEADSHLTPHFICYECGFVSEQRRTMTMHLNKVHKQDDTVESWVYGHVCHVCLKDFHQPNRLVAHIHRAQVCRRRWRLSLPVSPFPEVPEWRQLALEIQAQNRKRGFPENFAIEPAVRVSGPTIRLRGDSRGHQVEYPTVLLEARAKAGAGSLDIPCLPFAATDCIIVMGKSDS